MIIGNLFGGLGNQLFQLAAAQYYSKRFNQSLKFINFFNNFYSEDHTKFNLNNYYDLNITFIDQLYLKKEIGVFQSNFYISKLAYKFSLNLINTITDKKNTKLLSGRSYLLNGYFQNKIFFEELDLKIKEKFQNPIGKNELNNYSIYHKLKDKNSISIHIRGQDFLKYNDRIICDVNYYQKSINIIKKNVQNPFFYIFTDDEIYAKKLLSNLKINSLIVKNTFNSSINLHLMSICNHKIISNSTFAWWAAILSKSQNGIIISPSIWLRKSNLNLSLKEWIKI